MGEIARVSAPARKVVAVVAAVLAMIAGLFVAPAAIAAPAAPAAAAPASSPSIPTATSADLANFIPGYIISDQLFYDRNAMSQAQIQSFLEAKIGGCTNGRCLDVTWVDYPGRAADVSSRTGLTVCEAIPGGYIRISELIYRAQVACNISAKVILVTLQKEQGLVTKKAPNDYALMRAMGMACPDTAPCDPNALGLATQIVKGTAQLSCYRQCRFAKQPGVQYIQYDPDASCGGTTLNVQNYATAALYSYTPYQPNSSALAAGYNSSPDPCASYGNRNFWLYYNDWFGSSVGGSPSDAITSMYTFMGGASSALGAQVSAPACANDAVTCYRTYAHGVIYYNRSNGTMAVSGALGDYYLSKGGPAGPMGAPIWDQENITDPNGNGTGQKFTRGMVHSSAAGTFFVPTVILSAYSRAGWLRGSLKWPTSESTCGGPASGCVQTFQGGVISGPAQGTAAVMNPAIASYYMTSGGTTGPLGFPVATPETVTDPHGNGFAQKFENGMIHSSAKGTFPVNNKILVAYGANGWLRGFLGWPTTPETCTSSGCTQTFEGGTIVAPTSGPATVSYAVTHPAIKTVFDGQGGAGGPLGPAIAQAVTVSDPNGNGVVQQFLNGWIHSGPAGAFASPTSIMTGYSANGWLRGSLGWPTGAAVCDSTACQQPFQGGALRAPVGGTAYVIATVTNTAIKNVWDAQGGASGPLGNPVTQTQTVSDPNGNGVAQKFENGWIHSSSAGTFASPNSIMVGYSANGWLRGFLGWPTAAAVCDATACQQSFQGGDVRAPVGGTAYVIASVTNTAIKAVWDGQGGASGPLGNPVMQVQTVTDPNGNGFAQKFENGWIHSSSAGTFASPTAVMTVYSSRGWLRGSLGWPTGAAVCDTGGCIQQFQNGQIDTH